MIDGLEQGCALSTLDLPLMLEFLIFEVFWGPERRVGTVPLLADTLRSFAPFAALTLRKR